MISAYKAIATKWTPRTAATSTLLSKRLQVMVRFGELIGSFVVSRRQRNRTWPTLGGEYNKSHSIVLVLANGRQACFLGVCVIQNKTELHYMYFVRHYHCFWSKLSNGLLVQGTGILPVCKSSFKPALGLVSLVAERIRTRPPSTIHV